MSDASQIEELTYGSVNNKESQETYKRFEFEPVISSILGLNQNVANDSLETPGPQKKLPSSITEKAVLSHVSSVFDQLGLYSSFTMRMRMLLKSIWRKKNQQWDEEHEGNNAEQFTFAAINYICSRLIQCVL